MPCVASSTRRLMPLLLASVLLSSATLPSSAWASCAPDRGQEQPQDAEPVAPAQEPQPSVAPAALPDSDVDASSEARAALAAIGRLDDADTALSLAAEIVDGGWSLARLHRLIVLSAAYRQGSAASAEGLARDAQDRLLWRYPARRLEAEAIRDSMLAVSGLLDRSMGGRGFDLFRSRGGLDGFVPVETFSGEGLKRMVYAHKVRMEKESVFGAFDCPDAGQTAARRRQSTTPIAEWASAPAASETSPAEAPPKAD